MAGTQNVGISFDRNTSRGVKFINTSVSSIAERFFVTTSPIKLIVSAAKLPQLTSVSSNQNVQFTHTFLLNIYLKCQVQITYRYQFPPTQQVAMAFAKDNQERCTQTQHRYTFSSD
jgi:hypothetical protein